MASREAVYQKFGITAEAAQLFETELNTFLLGIEGLLRNWHIEPDAGTATKIARLLNRQTLGGLLRKLSTCAVSVDDDMGEVFASALEARNRLFHGFYEGHNFKIDTDEGRDIMIADLENLHTTLFNAWQLASRLSGAMLDSMIALQEAGLAIPPCVK